MQEQTHVLWTATFCVQVLRRSLQNSMRRSSRGSAGEESDEEWVEEQIERDESTESLDELGLPLSSSKSSSSPRPSSSHHFDPANLIVLDFGPAPKGGCHRPRRYVKYGLFLCFFFSNCFITENNVVELELFLKFEIQFSCLLETEVYPSLKFFSPPFYSRP